MAAQGYRTERKHMQAENYGGRVVSRGSGELDAVVGAELLGTVPDGAR